MEKHIDHPQSRYWRLRSTLEIVRVATYAVCQLIRVLAGDNIRDLL